MKCVLGFSNGVFNSLAPVKRGEDVDQLRKTRNKMAACERRRRGEERETHTAFVFQLPTKDKLTFFRRLPS